MTRHFNRTPETAKRRNLRRRATSTEQRLWRRLRDTQLGIKFRRQYGVDSYVLDFYAPACKLAVEVDGDSHFTAEAIEHDAHRSHHLEPFGIAVLRFTNANVANDIDAVLDSIKKAVEQRNPASGNASIE